jgi:Ca-activated chloride channel family protein
MSRVGPAILAVLLLLATGVPVLAQSGSSLPGTGREVPRPPTASSAHDASSPNPIDEKIPSFKVDVKLVNVFVTVLDPNGSPIGNLQKPDFQILEDGYPQQIAVFDRESQLPLSIVVAVDTSLSTRKDLKLELQSARRFAHSILRPVDALALFQFSEVVNEVVPFTADLKRIDRGLGDITVGSATALYDALYLGAEALQERQGRKVLVVITDGGDTYSKVSYQEALRAAQQAEAILYSIIIVPVPSSAGRDLGGEHALIQLSHDTGGKYYYADSLDRLDAAFRHISDELRTQYLLAYYPTRRIADSDFRRIEVRVRGEKEDSGDLIARYRSGYYTSKAK